MHLSVLASLAPALGDIRAAQTGDTIWINQGARERVDWGRYQDAIAHAVSRGADVRWIQ